MSKKPEQEIPKMVVRPVAQIISQFLHEIENHPDAQLGNCSINGPAPVGMLFKDTPRGAQHLTELRIVYRDSVEEVKDKQNQPWKWQGVIDNLNKPAPVVPDEKPNPKWAHLLAPENTEHREAATV